MRAKNHNRVYAFKVGQTVVTQDGLQGRIWARFHPPSERFYPCYVVKLSKVCLEGAHGWGYKTSLFVYAQFYLSPES